MANQVTFRGNGVVWDKDQGKALVEFVRVPKERNGLFTTGDKAVIEKLRAMGYEEMGEVSMPGPAPTDPVDQGPVTAADVVGQEDDGLTESEREADYQAELARQEIAARGDSLEDDDEMDEDE